MAGHVCFFYFFLLVAGFLLFVRKCYGHMPQVQTRARGKKEAVCLGLKSRLKCVESMTTPSFPQESGSGPTKTWWFSVGSLETVQKRMGCTQKKMYSGFVLAKANRPEYWVRLFLHPAFGAGSCLVPRLRENFRRGKDPKEHLKETS